MSDKDSTIDAAAIRTATEKISALAPAFRERFEAARNLLLRGGWTRQQGTLSVSFPDGHHVAGGECSCQEAGHIVCLHEIAIRILAVAGQPPCEVAA